MPLTPDEKHTLTALENQLREDDPALAAILAHGPRPAGRSSSYLLLARQVALLLGALFALAALGPVVADHFGALGICIITTSLIVPWLLASARACAGTADPVPEPRVARVRQA